MVADPRDLALMLFALLVMSLLVYMVAKTVPALAAVAFGKWAVEKAVEVAKG